VLLAAYTGFRMPNLWSVTHYTISWLDGFHRRFVIGTLLLPLSRAFHHSYELYATVAFILLGALLVVLVVAALRARLVSRRLLVVAFFLLPTGGFFFHEVGYLEQALYLLLFASLWLLRRSTLTLAPALMALAVCTHEIALFTVIPIFAFVALRDLAPRRAIAVVAPPLLMALALLIVPAIEPGAIERLQATLSGANFPPRLDALAVFQRSQSQSWDLYSIRDVGMFSAPLAIVEVAAFAVLYVSRSRMESDRFSFLRLASAVGAIAAPLLLAFAGWDKYRWAFLLTANFLIVVWLWLGDSDRELRPLQWSILAAVVLVSLRTPLLYFNHVEPRSLRSSAMNELRSQIADGTLFAIPRR